VTHRDLTHGANFARTPKELILLFDLCHLCDFTNVKSKCCGSRAVSQPHMLFVVCGDAGKLQEYLMHRHFETAAGTEER
jgi:hypothetical protein